MKKDLTPKQLKLFRDADERLFSKLSNEAISDVRKLHDSFIARLNRRLKRIKVPASQIAADAEKARLIRDIRSMFNETLGRNEDGFKEFASYRRLANRAERRALKYFDTFGEPVTFGRNSQTTLRLLLAEQEQGMFDLYDARLRKPLIRAVRQEAFGFGTSEALRAFTDSVREAGLDLSTAQIERAVDDGFRQVHRTANKLAANENDLLDVAVWEGPQDSKTSDQCNAMFDEAPYGVPGVWLKDDLAPGMVPGLAGDPEIEGGHPGCRHNFNYVDRDFAEEYLGAEFGDG